MGTPVIQAKIGDVCQDGFACRHMCTTRCARRVAQAAPIDNRTPLVSVSEDRRFNGMLSVQWRQIHYRGFTIQPKLDMGRSPHVSNGNMYQTEWVVVRNGRNAMPGAVYATSPINAKAMIDTFIEADEDPNKFWKLLEAFMV